MYEALMFTWDVPDHGYRWVKPMLGSTPRGAIDEADDYLISGPPLWGMGTPYAPLKLYTGLFRIFAETPLTKEGILAFANKYGTLQDTISQVIIKVPKDDGDFFNAHGEPLSSWRKEVSAMTRAVELWDALTTGNLDVLNKRIVWRENNDGVSVSYENSEEPPYHKLIADSHLSPEHLKRIRRGDVTQPALTILRWLINAHLENRVSPELVWYEEKRKLSFYLVPDNLIGALWLQFALAVDGNKQYQRCDACQIWFEVSPGTARTSKRYCSNACRVRAYRTRQASKGEV